jgi:cytochrome c oxidase cbb3-type subunit 3
MVHAFVGALFAVASLAACNRPTREWQADDHDQAPTNPMQVAAASGSAAASDDALIDTTWRSACASCHGMTGKGDGPNGAIVRAPDLTALPARSDPELAGVIRNGRGKMPGFGSLPPAVVDGLVRKVRALGAR